MRNVEAIRPVHSTRPTVHDHRRAKLILRLVAHEMHHNASNGIGEIVMRSRPVIDAVTASATYTPLKTT